ncbi:hypothetical protein ABK040_005446 [Willaertia magna]
MPPKKTSKKSTKKKDEEELIEEGEETNALDKMDSEENEEEEVKKEDKNAYIMGIDEAGRGPVIGPLVYAAVFCKAKYNTGNYLRKTFHVNDSKKLTAQTRAKIFSSLQQSKGMIHSYTNIIPSEVITSKSLARIKYNLNQMSHDCAIELIQRATDALSERGKYLREVYVDTVGDPRKYQTKLEEKFPEIEKIVVSKKADSLYPIVGAASIVAKVTRDDLIDKIQELPENKSLRMGSGYTSDKYTKEFLQKKLDKVFGYDDKIIRFSWSTIDKILNEKAVNVEWSDDEMEEDFNDSPTQSKLSFHVASASKQKYRIDYFSERNMELVTDF